MAKTPKALAAAPIEEEGAPKVSIKAMQWSLAVQATYEDKNGARSDTFRLENVQPDMSQADIEAAIKAHFV